jgi:hypothetical protein
MNRILVLNFSLEMKLISRVGLPCPQPKAIAAGVWQNWSAVRAPVKNRV